MNGYVRLKRLTPLPSWLVAESDFDPSQTQVLCEVESDFVDISSGERLPSGTQVVITAHVGSISDGMGSQDETKYVITPIKGDKEFKTLFCPIKLIKFAMIKPIKPSEFVPGKPDVQNARIFGSRVIYQLLEDPGSTVEAGMKKLKSGLFIPRRDFGEQITYVRVENIGSAVNSLFLGEKVEIGDLCIVAAKPAGQLIRLGMSDKPLWDGWAHDLLARWNPVAQRFIPLGDTVFLHHISSAYKYVQEKPKALGDQDKFLGLNEHLIPRKYIGSPMDVSKVLVPYTKPGLVFDQQGLVLASGGGIADAHLRAGGNAHNEIASGKFKLKRGDIAFHNRIFNFDGNYAHGESMGISVGGESPIQYIIKMSSIIGVKRKGMDGGKYDDEIRFYQDEWPQIDFQG